MRETALVMLALLGKRGDAKVVGDAGFTGYLVKPVRQRQVMETLAAVWATRSSGEDVGLVTRHTLAESRALDATCASSAQAEGKKVLGRRRVLRQSHEDSPRSREPRRVRRPRLAAKNLWRRLEAIRRLRHFIKGHADALAAWRNGNRNVEFPYGTYAMRVIHGVRCATAPS